MNTYTMMSHEDHLKTLAMAVARNKVGAELPLSDILLQQGVSEGDFEVHMNDAVFKRYLTTYARELEENGFSFATKCRILAEDAIQSMYLMVTDSDAPAAARVKAVENLVEWSGLGAKSKQDAATTNTPGFHITFNIPTVGALAQPTAAITIDATPTFNASFVPTEIAGLGLPTEVTKVSLLPVDNLTADLGYDAEE